jgi:colanic acid/amylovoran biosynthesis protein
LGDEAILESLLQLLKAEYPKASVVIHGYDSDDLHAKTKLSARTGLTSWIGDRSIPAIKQVGRLLAALSYISSTLLQVNLWLKQGQLTAIIDDYFTADMVVFTGGGYLRSKPGIRQAVYLWLQLLSIWLAVQTKRPVVVMPVSFGPFAYKWQAWLTAKILKSVTRLYIREQVSYNLVQQYGLIKASIRPDLAFNFAKLSEPPVTGKGKKLMVGINLRQWLPEKQQQAFEKHVTDAMVTLSRENDNMVVLPIVQADAPEHGDIDKAVVERVCNKLKEAKVVVRKPVLLQTVKQALRTYAGLDLLVGMRMHANILAATQHTPFVAISYEYKTEGVCQMLDWNGQVLACTSLTYKKLVEVIRRVVNSRTKLRTNLAKQVAAISLSYDEVFNL